MPALPRRVPKMTRQDIVLDDGEARLILYLHETDAEIRTNHHVRPCVLVCPGGGYVRCSEREQDPPALAFFAAGYQVGILLYSVQEKAAGLRPLRQASLALMELRRNCDQWRIDPHSIAVLGFSAGGHLAASLGTLWNHPRLVSMLDTCDGMNRPDALVLCYPVITTGSLSHEGSALNVSGGDPDLREFLSLENQVTDTVPPVFLWHTMDDDTVPVENSLLFVSALHRYGVPTECHLYPSGVHGLSMCNEEVGTVNGHCAGWFSLCLDWLNDLFGFVL